MKRFMAILCAIALFGASLSAQEADTLVVIVKHDDSGNKFFEKVGKPFSDTISTSRMYARKYRADIELSWSNPNTWGITSSHGYSFGNGLYVGGGAGFAAEWNGKDEPLYLVPVFADVKYSFINRLASPFVSLKGGAYADITNSGLRTFANPAVGVDIGRFSIKVGYEYQLGCWGNGDGVHTHQVKCGVGFTF